MMSSLRNIIIQARTATTRLPTSINRSHTTRAREFLSGLISEELLVMRAKTVMGSPGSKSVIIDRVKRPDLAAVVDRLVHAGWLRFANMEPEGSNPYGYFWPTPTAEWVLSTVK